MMRIGPIGILDFGIADFGLAEPQRRAAPAGPESGRGRARPRFEPDAKVARPAPRLRPVESPVNQGQRDLPKHRTHWPGPPTMTRIPSRRGSPRCAKFIGVNRGRARPRPGWLCGGGLLEGGRQAAGFHLRTHPTSNPSGTRLMSHLRHRFHRWETGSPHLCHQCHPWLKADTLAGYFRGSSSRSIS